MTRVFTNQQRSAQHLQKQLSLDISQPTAWFAKRLNPEQIGNYIVLLQQQLNSEAYNRIIQDHIDEQVQGKDIPFSALLMLLVEALYKVSIITFRKRLATFKAKLALLSDVEDLFKRSIAETLCRDLFPEYTKLDPLRVWTYLIHRYYVVFEK
jgi:hypothetical protein